MDVNDYGLLITTFLFVKTGKLAENIEIEIELTKGKNTWNLAQ